MSYFYLTWCTLNLILPLMLAVKWLGNAGSHDNDGTTIDDVFDAYEMTEHVLHEIFEPNKKRLKAIAKKVNKKKGPAKNA